MSKSTTHRKSQSAKARAFAQQGFTPLELERDYPGFGFKAGDAFGLEPVNVAESQPDDFIAVEVGGDVVIGHPYYISDDQFALASPVVLNRDEVKVLGRIAAV
jgi:hypothetical protein